MKYCRLIVILMLLGRTAAGSDRFDEIRHRWASYLVGESVGPVPGFRGQLARDTAADYTYSKEITNSYRRVFNLALAYERPGNPLFHDAGIRAVIFKELNWLYRNQYNESIALPVPAAGSDVHNWWDYKIGIPLLLNNVVVLLYEELPEKDRLRYMAAVAHFTPDWTDAYTRKPAVVQFTAANRVWVSTVIAVRALILKQAAGLKMASEGLSPVFVETASGDGFYADGSFIQHVKHPYTGGYGISLLTTLAEEIYLLSGTPWALGEKEVEHLRKWLDHSFAPVMFRGNVMSMVEGREISRPDAQGDKKGLLVAQAVKLLGDTLKPAAGYYQFAHMDRAVQQTSGYAFGVSMHSSRIYNYETRTNYENIKGWHTSDGMTYLYDADTGQYNDGFWATVNYFHLPGTTVEEDSQVPGFKTSSKNWVGGVVMGDYGASGMDLATAGQTLTGKKSWFMLNGKVVCLGAGISNKDGVEVNTYIEQRKLAAGAVFLTDNHTWAHLTSASAIGYCFLGGAGFSMNRTAQSGAWFDVNVNYSKQVISHEYLTLWQKQDNSHTEYAYVLLPGFSVNQTKAFTARPDVKILMNSNQQQAIYSESLKLTAVNFWQPGKVGGITCDGPAAVIRQGQQVAISDPTMLDGTIIVTLQESAIRVLRADPEIKVLSLAPVRFSFVGKKLDGRTAKVVFE